MQPQVGPDRIETFGSKPHLVRTLFGADVQRCSAAGGEELEEQRALADPRLATEQRDLTTKRFQQLPSQDAAGTVVRIEYNVEALPANPLGIDDCENRREVLRGCVVTISHRANSVMLDPIDFAATIARDHSLTTIGGQPAVGICGSGIISYVASAFRAGLLRKKGRYAKRDPRVEVAELLGERENVVRLTDEIYVSETDISNFLQAKAAVFAGLFTLCRMAGIEVFQLKKICIAGNFGRRIRIQDIMDIGIIPPLPIDRVEVVGNTSLKGVVHAAIDATARDRMTALISRLSFVELNAQPTFQDDFINALFIPHLKMEWGGDR